MKNNKNIFIASFTTFIFGLFFISSSVFALEYTPLAPLNADAPLNEQIGTGSINLADYLQQMFQLIIGFSAILAILMIVIGGVQYMMSDVVTDKSDAKKRIWSAITGLILAILSIFILGIVNKNILTTDLLEGVPQNPTEQQTEQTSENNIVIADTLLQEGALGNYCFQYKINSSSEIRTECYEDVLDCQKDIEIVREDFNAEIEMICSRMEGYEFVQLEFCYVREFQGDLTKVCGFSTFNDCVVEKDNKDIGSSAVYHYCREKLEFGVE